MNQKVQVSGKRRTRSIRLLSLRIAMGLGLLLTAFCHPGCKGCSDSWERSSVIAEAMGLVKSKLKAPKTADFDHTASRVLNHKDGHYLVFIAVDAENSFGASIRSHFLVMLEKREDGIYYNKNLSVVECENPPTEEEKHFMKNLLGWPDDKS